MVWLPGIGQVIFDLSDNEQDCRLAERLRDRIHIREPGGLEAAGADKITLEAITRSFQASRLRLAARCDGVLRRAGVAKELG